ncbi:fumarate hydratase [Shigella sonnei]
MPIEAQNLGLGAQFGGKYFAHDIRVIRLPRHGASVRSVWASPALLTVISKRRSTVREFEMKNGT